jgi:hypothetical protein
VYAPDAVTRARVRAAVGDTAVVSEQWPGFLRAAAAADCLAAVIPWLRDAAERARLAELRARFSRRALVLVTSRDADNVRQLQGIAVEELLWLHEIERDLVAATRRAHAHSLRCTIADAIDSAEQLAPRLREVLHAAAVRTQPVRSLRELAAMTRCHRTTLWYHWPRGTVRGPRLRPQDFVDWLLLLHAVAAKDPARNWSAAADAAGVHQHTLARIARRLLGRTLRAVERDGYADVAAAFEQHVLRPLCARGSTDCIAPRRSAVDPAAVAALPCASRPTRHHGRARTATNHHTEANMIDETLDQLTADVVALDEAEQRETVAGTFIGRWIGAILAWCDRNGAPFTDNGIPVSGA